MYMSPQALTKLISTAVPFPSGHLFNRRLTPESFVTRVSRLNSLAIQVHRTATIRTQQPEIRGYARHMADGHIWMNEALLTSVEKAGLTLPLEYTPDIEQQKRLDELQLGDAWHFDVDYIQLQNHIYLEIITLCEQFSLIRGNANLEIYAVTMCNYLKYHLEQFGIAANGEALAHAS